MRLAFTAAIALFAMALGLEPSARTLAAAAIERARLSSAKEMRWREFARTR